MSARKSGGTTRSISITGGHSNQDQICLENIVCYIGFCVYRGSYLLWSPVKVGQVIMFYGAEGGAIKSIRPPQYLLFLWFILRSGMLLSYQG